MHIESNDSHLRLLLGSTTMGASGLTRQLRIRARSATRQVEGGGQITTRALSSSDITACPPYVFPTPQSRWPDDSRSVGSRKRGLACRAYTCQITILSSRITGRSNFVWVQCSD